ncbi:MAG: type II secretion system protein [Candidatus Riflebacteria bacterium]|nr:type II secretion system protein [Candidatus Riflebacteria bacterium]
MDRTSIKKAYTLPELLITILLMAILFTLAIILTSGFDHSKKLRDYNVAVALAQQALEIARSSPYDLLDDETAGSNSLETDFNSVNGDNDLIVPDYDSGFVKYHRNVEIRDIKASTDQNRSIGLKTIKVTVEWKSPETGKKEVFVVSSSIADIN